MTHCQVFKYPLKHGINGVMTPDGPSRVLSVGKDLEGNMCCWVQVTHPTSGRPGKGHMVWLGWTGEIVGRFDNVRFLGTFIADGLIWHGFVMEDQS